MSKRKNNVNSGEGVFIVTVFSMTQIAYQYAYTDYDSAESKFVSTVNAEYGIDAEIYDDAIEYMCSEEFLDEGYDYTVSLEEVVLESYFKE